jgi:hypothetical protein
MILKKYYRFIFSTVSSVLIVTFTVLQYHLESRALSNIRVTNHVTELYNLNDTLDIIKTKDGKVLGKRNEIEKELIIRLNSKQFAEKSLEVGLKVDTALFISCVFQEINNSTLFEIQQWEIAGHILGDFNKKINNCFLKSLNDISDDSSNIIRSKEGMVIGTKSTLSKAVLPLSFVKKIESLGVEIDTSKMYNCIFDLYSQTKYDVIIGSSKGSLTNDRKTMVNQFEDCLTNSLSLNHFTKETIFKHCRDVIFKEPRYQNLISVSTNVNSFNTICECFATNSLLNEESKRETIRTFLDEKRLDSILIPCLPKAKSHVIRQDINKSLYDINDIEGSKDSTNIPLIQIGNRQMVKISIGSSSKPFIFDAGFDYLVINKELEKTLLQEKILESSKKYDERLIKIADNTQAKLKFYKIDKVKIGDFKVRNVEIGVIDNGYLRCGLSLLNKFKKWKIDLESNTLTLFK